MNAFEPFALHPSFIRRSPTLSAKALAKAEGRRRTLYRPAHTLTESTQAMHPILSERRIFFLYLTVWLIAGGLLGALLHTTGMPIAGAIALAVPMTLVYSFMCLASYYLCRTFPLHRVDIIRMILIHSIAAALSSSVWISLGKTWVSLLVEVPFFSSVGNHFTAQVPLLFTVGATLFLLSIAVHYSIIAFRESREAERRAMELRLLAQDAELRALRSQINPHFLFNSLNSVSALTTQDPQGARAMTLGLADFLRKSLSVGTKPFISLDEELDLARGFLKIEQIRYGSRLNFEESIDNEARHCLVPPLILQPLIENAIGHGIGHLVEGGRISLVAERKGPFLRIIVRNPFDPEQQGRKGQGIGLNNIRNRLMTLYRDGARIETRASGNSFVAEIVLPVTNAAGQHAESAVHSL